jgi:hypothetical protein
MIPWFHGAILSREWKEALWNRFATQAPRPVTRQLIASQSMKGRVRRRRGKPDGLPAIGSWDGPNDRKLRSGGQAPERGISPKTAAKWRTRSTVEDLKKWVDRAGDTELSEAEPCRGAPSSG